MLLDTSDNAWEMFLQIAKKAKDANTIWYSPKKQHPYEIEDVGKKVFIKREKGETSELGKRGFLYFLKHFNDNAGIYKRKDYRSSVAKMACIVNFHPLLKWSEDYEIMKVIPSPSKGFGTYTDFGDPPDDDIDQLQIFARKVRKGQVKFRQELLKVYGGACCVSGSAVEETLDACHIEPHAKSGINKIANGLLLRTDIHNLFDLQLLFIEPQTYKVHIHPRLKGSEYYEYNGKQIRYSPVAPGNEYLDKKWKEKNW
jgi:hypothetical protein